MSLKTMYEHFGELQEQKTMQKNYQSKIGGEYRKCRKI